MSIHEFLMTGVNDFLRFLTASFHTSTRFWVYQIMWIFFYLSLCTRLFPTSVPHPLHLSLTHITYPLHLPKGLPLSYIM